MNERRGIPICCSLKSAANSEVSFFVKAYTCFIIVVVKKEHSRIVREPGHLISIWGGGGGQEMLSGLDFFFLHT